jgi:hypothetical protein
MTRKNKIITIAIASTLLIGGFAFGQLANTPKSNAAEDNKALVQPSASPLTDQAAKEAQQFYLSDFKTGYNDGYNAGLTSEPSTVITTQRAGYNDGYKSGYTDGYKARIAPPPTTVVAAAPRPVRVQREVVYRSAPAPRKKGSTLNTVLQIAAPAAIGAGVGGAVGGGKGAGVGALIGGGGGAVYTLIKNRDRDRDQE